MEGICDTSLLQDNSQESGTEYQPSSKAVQRLQSVLITVHTGEINPGILIFDSFRLLQLHHELLLHSEDSPS